MLNHVCIVGSDWETTAKNKAIFKSSIPVFLVGKNEKPLQQLFKMLYECAWHTDVKFSVCFDFRANEMLQQPVAQQCYDNFICNIIFHPFFYVQNGIPVFFYLSDHGNNEAARQQLDAISTTLQMQSFSNTHAVELSKEPEQVTGTGAVIIDFNKNDKDALTGAYTTILEHGLFNKYIAIEDNGFATEEVEQLLMQAEEKFRQAYPLQYTLMQSLAQITNENELLLWKQKEQSNELANYKTYLQVMHDQDEAATINRFYHFEYEILPLWYKRLGHLIKVVTGARTFRSLFDDTIKKYRQ